LGSGREADEERSTVLPGPLYSSDGDGSESVDVDEDVDAEEPEDV